jgi:hypothetical protein
MLQDGNATREAHDAMYTSFVPPNINCIAVEYHNGSESKYITETSRKEVHVYSIMQMESRGQRETERGCDIPILEMVSIRKNISAILICLTAAFSL